MPYRFHCSSFRSIIAYSVFPGHRHTLLLRFSLAAYISLLLPPWAERLVKRCICVKQKSQQVITAWGRWWPACLPPFSSRSLLSHSPFYFLFPSLFSVLRWEITEHSWQGGSVLLTALIGQLSPPETIAWIKEGVFVALVWFLSSGCGTVDCFSSREKNMYLLCVCLSVWVFTLETCCDMSW